MEKQEKKQVKKKKKFRVLKIFLAIILILLFTISLTFVFTSCKKDESKDDPKNETEKVVPMIKEVVVVLVFINEEICVIKVVSPKREMFALPIILMFIEYRAIIVRIPAKIPGIFNFVFSNPVTIPEIPPAIKEIKSATKGLQSKTMRAAFTAPPKAKLPSTVKSAKSSTLYVIYSPKHMIPQRTPWETAPYIASKIFICSPIKSQREKYKKTV